MTHRQQRAADGLPTSANRSKPGAGQPAGQLSPPPSSRRRFSAIGAEWLPVFALVDKSRLKAPKTRPGAASGRDYTTPHAIDQTVTPIKPKRRANWLIMAETLAATGGQVAQRSRAPNLVLSDASTITFAMSTPQTVLRGRFAHPNGRRRTTGPETVASPP